MVNKASTIAWKRHSISFRVWSLDILEHRGISSTTNKQKAQWWLTLFSSNNDEDIIRLHRDAPTIVQFDHQDCISDTNIANIIRIFWYVDLHWTKCKPVHRRLQQPVYHRYQKKNKSEICASICSRDRMIDVACETQRTHLNSFTGNVNFSHFQDRDGEARYDSFDCHNNELICSNFCSM